VATQRRIGISYTRFSDPKQSQGDSAERQAAMYRAFCQHHNLTPLTEVFLDKGRSGYHDEHRKKGKLGVLIQYAKDGRFEPGSVIVIEAWDRLGRLRPDKQTALVAELLQTGVDIGVCQLNDIFTETDFGTFKWAGLSTFIMLAYQESLQKARRVTSSWKSRHQQARTNGRLTTTRIPAWLEPVNGELKQRPGPAAAVRRIFELAGQGCGRARIIATLLKEKVPPFGRTGRWSRSYVRRILSDKRVTGVYQPCKQRDKPDGPPIADYFPRLISDAEWAMARAGQERRRGTDRRGRALARTERKNVNLFRGLLTHAPDGGTFFLHQKRPQDGCPLVLCNSAGPEGRTRTVTFPYHVFEQAILSLLREVDPEEVLPRAKQTPSQADVVRAKLANVRADLAGLKADLEAGYSKTLADVVRTKEAEEERLAGELQEELAKAARPAERAWRDLPGLADLVAEGGDEARLKLRPVLRRVVEGMWVLIVRRGSYQLAAVQVRFADSDKVRDYLILHQTAGFHRPGGWWPLSFADVMEPIYDLRRPEDARQLEADLAALDLSDLG
jgi:DNA invertase Pin-like site-specific DNA recombinase